jgi:GT2 family glycosyltransferase
MNVTPQIAIIIVSYNTKELLLECLASVMESQHDFELEIVVVDNASQDGSLEAVRLTFPQVLALENERNLGFGAACNQAIRATNAPFILLLNSDARLTKGSLGILFDGVRLHERCAAIGCKMLNAQDLEVSNTRYFLNPFNQALEHLGVARILPVPYLHRTCRPQLNEQLMDCSINWIEGSCLLLRRSALDEAGLFDERFFMYSEDEDLCLRLKQKGWAICYSAACATYHHGSASSAGNRPEMFYHFYASQLRFLDKHNGRRATRVYQLAMKLVLFLKRLLYAGGKRAEDYRERLRAFNRACRERSKV